MKNLIFILPFLLFISCNEHINDPGTESSNVPIVITPLNESEFNTLEEIRIDWKSDSSGYFEIQLLSNNDRFYTILDKALFDSSSINTSRIIEHHYAFVMGEPLNNDLYFGFRVRKIADIDTSKWSNIISFVVYPISRMTKIPVTINAEYNFISQNKYPYYSDVVAGGSINLDSLLNQKGYNINNARAIKPDRGEIYYEGYQNGLKDFSRFVFGIDSTKDHFWPFDVIAVAHVSGDSIPGLGFNPFGGTYRNFKAFFSRENPLINMAYCLKDTTKVNFTHKVTAKITFDVFYR
jgi:hypothetical protein